MKRNSLVWLAAGASILILSVACGGGSGDDNPDAGGNIDGSGPHDAAPDATVDALTPADLFDHFTFEISPTVPLALRDFQLTVTAYSSTDDSVQLGYYEGTVSVTASDGVVSGDISEVTITGGEATLTLQINAPVTDVTLTVTDDSYSSVTGTTDPFTVAPRGSQAVVRDVVINEVNWFGNTDTADEWIELRNTSGMTMQLSEWTLENAGPAGSPTIQLANGTALEAGAYLVIAKMQGPDTNGERTSLTGVDGVDLYDVSLVNEGEQLVLKDPDGTVIDSTPTGAWPAGNNTVKYSMERRDNITGGGYTDGSVSAAWYTWSSLDGTDTTNADSTDKGTPGAANSDPEVFDHFSFEATPTTPVVATDFTLTVTAYSSVDDSVQIAGYNGTITLTFTGAGTLTGEMASQPITGGTATLTLQYDAIGSDLVITATDDLYPDITDSSAAITIRPEGDTAALRDVVISEINWYGTSDTSADEWIELRNVSGGTLNLSGWTIDGASTGSNAITIDSGTVLADGAFLVIGRLQGNDADGERTSLTGVSNVQIQLLSLSNDGEVLSLRDVDGNLVDETPSGAWPAGVPQPYYRSMERNDSAYGDGTSAAEWHTWRTAGGVDTTSPDTSDSGTPGTTNSPPPSTLYQTSFEVSEPNFDISAGAGTASNIPPDPITARTGSSVITTDSLTTAYAGRQLDSVDCVALVNTADLLIVTSWGRASPDNLGNDIYGRIRILWFTDDQCLTPSSSAFSNGTGLVLPQDAYKLVGFSGLPPADSTHFKIRFDAHDLNGTDPDEFAADDVAAVQ